MLSDTLRAAAQAVAVNRTRTALTAASVAVGICSVVVMSSLARSSLVTMVQRFEQMGGARLLAIFPKSAEGPRARYARPLDRADVEVLRRRLPRITWVSAQTVLGEQIVRSGSQETSAEVLAADAGVLEVLQLPILAGRGLVAADTAEGARVALLSHDVATAIFPDPRQALGRFLRLADVTYTVVGVLARSTPSFMSFPYDLDRLVVLPQQAQGPDITFIFVGTERRVYNRTIAGVAAGILAARHNEADDVRIFDYSRSMDRFKSLLRTVELTAAAIAAIALLAGAAGTTNVLMVSMHEQIREIGVRKALGAPASAIVIQFVLQAFFMAGLGVAAGLASGSLLLLVGDGIVRRFREEWITVAAFEPIVFGVAAAFLVTGLASLIPAFRVKRLSILECLRARS